MILPTISTTLPATAPCPRVFQVTPLVLCLATVFPVLALCIVQLLFGFLHLPFAFIIAIAVHRTRGNHSAQERQNNKRRNEYLGFLEHASSSGCTYILLLDAHASHLPRVHPVSDAIYIAV
jgi:hypothetical protein